MPVNEQSGLPEEQKQALRKAKRLEWLSLAYTACTVTVVAFVLGNSQAMKTAWVEDILSTLPQFAFLLAAVFITRNSTLKHPYGYHRSMNIGHLVGSFALIVVGAILAFEAASGLIKEEHASIGTLQLFGHTVWMGWIMVTVMAIIAVPPIFLGRAKMRVAKLLHNKLLFADADMSKADWSTNVGSIVGVLGIGMGWWWADGIAALFISAGILRDALYVRLVVSHSVLLKEPTMSSISKGYTRDEIREFVHEYYLQPHGTKTAWLESNDLTVWTFRQWRTMVFEGDLDRNLVPRDDGDMTRKNGQRSAYERMRAREIAEHHAKVEKLEKHIAELEGTSSALGKAIGLLHELSAAAPDTTQTSEQPGSSTPKTTSSGS